MKLPRRAVRRWRGRWAATSSSYSWTACRSARRRGLHPGRRQAGAPQRVPADGVPRVPARRVSVRSHRVVLLLSVGLWHLAVAARRPLWHRWRALHRRDTRQVHRRADVVKRVPGLPDTCIRNLDRQRQQAVHRQSAARAVPLIDSQGGGRGGVLGIPPGRHPGRLARSLAGRRWRAGGTPSTCCFTQAARPHAPLPTQNEGAQVHAALLWDQRPADGRPDPWGLMENAPDTEDECGVMGFYGRWFLPIPRRVALSVCVAPVRTTKTASPSAEDVERLHRTASTAAWPPSTTRTACVAGTATGGIGCKSL